MAEKEAEQEALRRPFKQQQRKGRAGDRADNTNYEERRYTPGGTGGDGGRQRRQPGGEQQQGRRGAQADTAFPVYQRGAKRPPGDSAAAVSAY
jgi:hypothetical protein